MHRSAGSGFITFDELQAVVRNTLHKDSSVLSDSKLQQLWCSLDADNSNQVVPEEFGKFLRRSGGFIKAKGPDNLNKRSIELGGAQTAGLGRALESTPTAELRAKLEAPLGEDELTELSHKLCEWLAESLRAQSKSIHSWYNLFNDADLDGDGVITLDEFQNVVRLRLKKGSSELSDDKLHALWCHLDEDDSNEILPQEMSKFLKRNLQKSRGQENLNKRNIELGGAQTAGLGRALESTPTAEMRAKLEAPLTEAELDDLSKKVTSWLEELMYKKNMATHSWFNLFKEADEDGMAHTAQPLQSTRTCAVILCVCVYMPLICARPFIGVCQPRACTCASDLPAQVPASSPFTSSKTSCAARPKRVRASCRRRSSGRSGARSIPTTPIRSCRRRWASSSSVPGARALRWARAPPI